MGEECEGEKVESCSLGIWRQKGGGRAGGILAFLLRAPKKLSHANNIRSSCY